MCTTSATISIRPCRNTGICFLLLILSGWIPAIRYSHAADSVIAYVSSSIDNQEIRLISPDGSHDRALWRVPAASHALDGIGTLSWKPDGTELAFDSGHNWQRSMSIRDLYAIASDGTNLRRVTAPPGPEGSRDLPKGTVTFIMNAFEQGDVQVYVDGAQEPVSYFARQFEDYRITTEVADWGEGVRQYIRLWDPDLNDPPCTFSEEGWVDVVPGQVTDLGTVHFGVVREVNCPRMFSPTWSQDGNRILYLRRPVSNDLYPLNDIWRIDAHAAPASIGSLVFDHNANSPNSNRIYRVVSAPVAERENELLFLLEVALQDLIFHTTTENPVSHTPINNWRCPLTRCTVLDIAWLPDGSGFVFSQQETDFTSTHGGVLYRYSFADNAVAPVLVLPGEIIGRLAVSPDGTAVAFERGPTLDGSVDYLGQGPRLQCPCALWTMNLDGDGLRLLAADGRAPTWGTVVTAPPEPST